MLFAVSESTNVLYFILYFNTMSVQVRRRNISFAYEALSSDEKEKQGKQVYKVAGCKGVPNVCWLDPGVVLDPARDGATMYVVSYIEHFCAIKAVT